MKSSRFTFLFHRYVNNTSTPEEKAEFLQFLQSSENDDELKFLLDQLWDEAPDKKLSDERATAIYKVALKGDRTSLSRASVFFSFRKIAAVLLLGIIGGGTFLYVSQYPNAKYPLSAQAGESAKQHTFIQLPDGSTVVLNAGSHLEFPDSFENTPTREVSLIGEGFFDIKHDESKPFIVRTGKLTTTVLGTAFNVKAFADESNITVTVTRGKVKVSDNEKVLGIISPDQQIVFDKVTDKASQVIVNAHQAIVWVENDIFFEDITMADAVNQLTERFMVKILLSNEAIRQCRFTATFVNGENLDQILGVICEFNKATFKYEASGAIVIDGDGCEKQNTPNPNP
jgi:ferric-dicitrate binding protein FerR (iron transport regulator)